jgi:hypothetical protein
MAYLIEGKNHRVIYCANYRVGSGATAEALMEMGATKLGEHHDPPEPWYVTPDTIVVETVRHHCDVMVSWWFWRNSRISLTKLVRYVLDGHHGALQSDAFYNRYDSNYLLQYATLDFEWEVLCLNAGIEHRPLPVKETKRTDGVKWESLVPYELREEVEERYGDEMARLGFSTE